MAHFITRTGDQKKRLALRINFTQTYKNLLLRKQLPHSSWI